MAMPARRAVSPRRSQAASGRSSASAPANSAYTLSARANRTAKLPNCGMVEGLGRLFFQKRGSQATVYKRANGGYLQLTPAVAPTGQVPAVTPPGVGIAAERRVPPGSTREAGRAFAARRR